MRRIPLALAALTLTMTSCSSTDSGGKGESAASTSPSATSSTTKSATPTPSAAATEAESETPAASAVITAENAPGFAALLAVKHHDDPAVENFAADHRGQIIQFDGIVAYTAGTSSQDLTVFGGDDPRQDAAMGPAFRFPSVTVGDMGFEPADAEPEYIAEWDQFRFTARVVQYHPDYDKLELEPVSTEVLRLFSRNSSR
jgi:hypothetical protein